MDKVRSDADSGDAKDNRRRMIPFKMIVDVIIWLAVALPVLFIYLRGVPNERGFFCDDATIGYPYKEDSVSTAELLLWGFGIAIGVSILVEVLNCVEQKCKQTCGIGNILSLGIKWFAGFLVGFVIQELFVEIIKNQFGELRPNFKDVCRPQFNTSQCPGFITKYTCTGSNTDDIRDSRRSFPSGHSSFAMYTALFYSFYLHERLAITFSIILKTVAQSMLVLVAVMCGLGRITDHKHHPCDVIIGFLLGAIVALLVYKYVMPSILQTNSEKKLTDDDRDALTSVQCCTCAQTPEAEPNTPSALIPNDFLRNVGKSSRVQNLHDDQSQGQGRRHTFGSSSFSPNG